MTVWHISSATDAQWDAWLRTFPGAYVYQSSAWARYKQQAGWRKVRLFLPGDPGEGDAPRALVQGLIKRVPLIGGMMWVPGGPQWHDAALTQENAVLGAALGRAGGARYVRLLDMSEATAAPRGAGPSATASHPGAAPAYAMPWRRPRVRNGSGVSVLIDVTQERELWLAALTSKHRYYVRRALREPMQWRTGNDALQLAALATLTDEMSRLKGAAHQRAEEDLHVQSAALGSSVLTLVGYRGDRAVTACQVLCWGTMAIYATAATNEAGREISAAYAMIAQLREVLRAAGVETLDFGGIDPDNPAARGVDHFKMGFGGRTLSYAGEWEWATSPWVRAFGNLAVRVRRGAGA